jgi:hypothetical protein
MKDRPTPEEVAAAIKEWYAEYEGKQSFKQFMKQKFSQYDSTLLLEALKQYKE